MAPPDSSPTQTDGASSEQRSISDLLQQLSEPEQAAESVREDLEQTKEKAKEGRA